MTSIAYRVAARFTQGINAAVDLSTPVKAAAYLRSELRSLFPGHHVKVIGERGVSIEVARLDDEAYAKERWIKGYVDTPPNLMVKIVMAPGFGASGWADLNVGPAQKNPELTDAGITPIRRMSNVTPEKGTEAILKWFKANRTALKG